MLRGLLLLVCLGTALASECGTLQRLKIKKLWAQAYSSGHERMEFGQAIWKVFLRGHGEYRGLFKRVGVEDTSSPAFKAHIVRVLGGLDAIISVIEDKELLHEVLHHYANFHVKFGKLPYKEFGKAIGMVMPSNTGHCFDADIWDACFDLLDKQMTASDLSQSPIDIDTDVASFDTLLLDSAWDMHYIPGNTKDLVNNGHTIKVSIDPAGTKLSGGPLGKKHFCLAQFHFHWGSKLGRGSEHTVDGYAYPAELHLVHYNCERYTSIAEAVPSEDGLAVLGVFLQVGSEENAALKQITEQLDKIKYKDQSVAIGPLDPSDLLPSNTAAYWTYAGSLTTPPYSETVTWTVFRDPITITQKQLVQLRHLVTYKEGEDPGHGDDHGDDHGDEHHSGPLVDNYRPTQPLNGRLIRATFH